MRGLLVVPILLMAGVSSEAQWRLEASGTSERLRGVSAPSEQVAWASGAGGTILRTVDGGKTWQRRPVPGALNLDFRDIEAFDADRALALSIGAGDLSRIYKTGDGGKTWRAVYMNKDPKGFLDALAFWSPERGVALGDQVDGRFVVLTTGDGGESWSRIGPEGLPPALDGEAAFAASGTCLSVQGEGRAWFATSSARVYRSTDGGKSWSVQDAPIQRGQASEGIFSVSIPDGLRGAVVGGDYKNPGQRGNIAALTADGGLTWRLPSGALPGGYRSAVAARCDGVRARLIAVGPTGTDVSFDGGESWRGLGAEGFHAVTFASSRTALAVGEQGRIGRIELPDVASSPRQD